MKKYSQIALRVNDYQKSEIERIATKRDMSQQKVVRMMVDIGIDCHRDLEKFGIINAVDFAYFVKKALRKTIDESGKKQLHLV